MDTKNNYIKLKRIKYRGFTLVELIVVITILTILGAIGFTQMQGYSSSARDSSRIENLSNLQKGLSVFQIKAGTYPIPEGAVSITASGTIIGYQGFAKDVVGNIAKISPGGTKDPLDSSIHTTYSVNANQAKMQLMGFLEDGSNVSAFVPTVYAGSGTDYSKRYPLVRGDTLGILLGNTGSSLNQPVQESGSGVDVVRTTTLSGYTLVFSKNDSTASVATSGTGAYTGSLFTFTYNKRGDLLRDKTLASLDQSLVGDWDMETNYLSGSVIYMKDFSQSINDGHLVGGPNYPSISVGKIGGGLLFKGNNPTTSGYLRIKNQSNSFSGKNALTVSTWLNFSTMPTNGTSCVWKTHIFTTGGQWGSALCFSSGAYDLNINSKYSDPFVYSSLTGALNIQENEWAHIVAIFDFQNKNLKIYKNGSLIGSKNNLSHILAGIYTPEPGIFIADNIGYGTGLGNSIVNGIIDEVRIYNRALSDSEIQTLYGATK